jgi:hypothetical protein
MATSPHRSPLPEIQVHMLTRSDEAQALALRSTSVGGESAASLELLDAAMMFAPFGTLVPRAREALDRGQLHRNRQHPTPRSPRAQLRARCLRAAKALQRHGERPAGRRRVPRSGGMDPGAGLHDPASNESKQQGARRSGWRSRDRCRSPPLQGDGPRILRVERSRSVAAGRHRCPDHARCAPRLPLCWGQSCGCPARPKAPFDLGVHGPKPRFRPRHETWGNRMLRSLRTEGMVVEDGPRLSGCWVSIGSMIRAPRHRRSRTLHSLGTAHAGQAVDQGLWATDRQYSPNDHPAYPAGRWSMLRSCRDAHLL